MNECKFTLLKKKKNVPKNVPDYIKTTEYIKIQKLMNALTTGFFKNI